MAQLEKEMQKTARNIDSLKNKMNALSAVKTPTQDYKDVSKQIADAEKKQAALNDRMEKFVELGGKTNSKQYKSMQYDATELENTIAYAKGELQDLVDTGKAFTLGNTTTEFNSLSQQLGDEQAHLNGLSDQYSQLQNRVENTSSWESLAVVFNKIKSVAKSAFLAPISGMRKTVGAARTLAKGLNGVVSGLKKAASFGVKTVGALSGLSGLSKVLGGTIGGLGKRIFSLAKTAFVFGVLRRAFTSLRTGVQESFGTYLRYDSELKTSINGLKAQLSALKGSLASAFAPIISAVVPYLSTLISWVTTAANAVAAFIATLSGKTSYKKAVANVGAVGAAADDTAGSLGNAKDAAEELEKALGKYDDLNVIDQPKNSSGGSGGSGGGSGAGAGDITYEDVEIDSAISDFAEKVKEAWKTADFTEVGTIIGTKLNEALNNIPWDDIQDAASKIGSSLATFINGAIEVEGLGKSIGVTIAEAINTGIVGLKSLTGKVHWDSVGTFVSDGINGALNTIQWNDLETVAKNLGSGLADALNKIMTPETFGNIGSSFASAVKTVVEGAYTFVTDADWGNWGSAIASAVNKFFTDFDWKKAGLTFESAAKGILKLLKDAVTDISWSGVGTSICDALKTVNWGDLLKSAADLIGSIFSGLLDFAGAVKTRLSGSEWDNYILNIKEANKALENANDEIQKRIENASEWAKAEEEYKYAEELADKYFDLAEKEKLSNAEKEEMKDLAKELVNTIPSLQNYYNTETGLLDTTRSSVNNLIESLKAKARVEAAQDALKELYSAQMDAKDAMDQCDKKAKELAEQHDLLAAEYEKATKEVKKYTDAGDYETQASQQASQQASYYKTELEKLESQQAANTKAMENAAENYNAAGKEIDKITDYVAEYSSEAKTAAEKTNDLTEKLKNLSKNSKITITMSMNGMEVSTQQKLQVIAEVTGTDYSRLPVSEKYINDMYANIIKAYPQAGVTLSTPMSATSLMNGGQTLYAPMKANSLSNNGQTVITPMKANGLSNNGHAVTAPIKASKVSGDGKTITAPIKASKITNSKTVSSKVKVTGFTNTPTLKAKVKAVDSMWARNSAVGGVNKHGVWSNLPQKALGGILQSSFWRNIPAYAGGGSPHGTMFVAGEAGPEIVGHIGGRTEVLNKSQIASAIYSAVSDAMREAIYSLGYSILQNMAECTNMVIANMANIVDAIYRSGNLTSERNVQFAGMPVSYTVPDTNKVSMPSGGSSGILSIDYDRLAGAVAKRISGNIEIRNNMTLDGQVVYNRMVSLNRAHIKQTGRSAFER